MQKTNYLKKVEQYNLEGKLLYTFINAFEASKQFSNYSSIINCCKGKYKTTGGYIWKFEGEEAQQIIKKVDHICKICKSEENIRSMAMHLRFAHNIKTEEYVEKYGEYRPKKNMVINKKKESIIECKICNEKMMHNRQLSHHITKKHKNITQEKYVLKYYLNNIHPLCKCGCKSKVSILLYNTDKDGKLQYYADYIKGHWDWVKPGYHYHSDESKLKMRKSAIKRIENEKGLFKGISKGEIEDYIKEIYNEKLIYNDIEILNGKELDIYLPDINLAIEYNGTYFHSDLFREGKLRHIKKTKECEKQNIQLLHIWDCDWKRKKPIIESIIRSKVNKIENKIYARKCIIKEISSKEKIEFLDQNHLQGPSISKINYGLYYNDELVSVMTFGKLRKNMNQVHKEGHFELIRFCNKLNTTVIGGASKLLIHFIKTEKPLNIISYANRDISNGNLYEKLGFNKVHETTPGYHWYKSGIRYNRFNFRKSNLIKQGEDPNKTEYEIMLKNGYYRTWNSGNIKYKWNNIL